MNVSECPFDAVSGKKGAILVKLSCRISTLENTELEPHSVPEDPVKSDRHVPLVDLPARTLVAQVADPAHNSGGGVAAGLALAAAAASAELVLKLAARRKSLAADRPRIEPLLDVVAAHRSSFEDAADRDVAAFSQLVEAQRAAKELKEAQPEAAHLALQRAYVHAASVPLAFAEEGLAFMYEVEAGLEFASRFTISDLGAAAALARGAIDAALLTVDANLSYVDDDSADEMKSRLARIHSEAAEVAERVVARARHSIAHGTQGS